MSKFKQYTCRRDVLTDLITDWQLDDAAIVSKYGHVYDQIAHTGSRPQFSRKVRFNSQEEFNNCLTATMSTIKMVIAKYKQKSLIRQMHAVNVLPYLKRLYINWFNDESLDQMLILDAGAGVAEDVCTFLISTLTEQNFALRRASTGDFDTIANKVANKHDKSYSADDVQSASIDSVEEQKIYAKETLRSSRSNMDDFRGNLDKILKQVQTCKDIRAGKI